MQTFKQIENFFPKKPPFLTYQLMYYILMLHALFLQNLRFNLHVCTGQVFANDSLVLHLCFHDVYPTFSVTVGFTVAATVEAGLVFSPGVV